MTTQIRPSRLSRFSAFKAIILCLLAGAACISFVGCGSDTESSTSPIGEITSSSSDEVIESSDGYAFLLTSSSEQGSSSSITPNESSSSVQSSSSEVAAVSSSSDVVAESSSSDKAESSSSEKSSSSVEESSSSVESSSSEVPSSSSVVESSSSVAESSSSEIMISSSSLTESSSSEESSSSQQNVILDSSYYDAEENTLKDFRDGRIYKTITIGTQIWMAENLKLQKFGTKNIKSFCYDNKSINCEQVGRLYIRSSALDSAALFSKNSKGCGDIDKACSIVKPVRGICPKNWHLADTTEWKTLISSVEGKKDNLKAISGWDETCTKNLTNGKYGFDAFPGYQQGDAQSYTLNMARFWAATTTRHVVGLSCYETDGYLLISNPAYFAVSVRCIKDN